METDIKLGFGSADLHWIADQAGSTSICMGNGKDVNTEKVLMTVYGKKSTGYLPYPLRNFQHGK